MRDYGIAYCVRFEPSEMTFRISGGYCYSSDRRGFISLPKSWTFDWPVVDPHQFVRYGASQIQGLLGGIDDDWQKARSDAIERAIGDVLTLLVCEILDTEHSEGPKNINILGPALHKCVGRIASLRPPSDASIAWVCPIPFPTWIVEGANDPVIVPSICATQDLLWEEEPLVLTRTADFPGNGKLVIQQLNLWSSDDNPWRQSEGNRLGAKLWGSMLPKEVVVASGQVHLHSKEPYASRSLQSHLSELKGDWEQHRALYEVVEHDDSMEAESLPGWVIEWLQ